LRLAELITPPAAGLFILVAGLAEIRMVRSLVRFQPELEIQFFAKGGEGLVSLGACWPRFVDSVAAANQWLQFDDVIAEGRIETLVFNYVFSGTPVFGSTWSPRRLLSGPELARLRIGVRRLRRSVIVRRTQHEFRGCVRFNRE
jgi:hypothetical protein